MKLPVAVVIITKNEESQILASITAAKQISDEIIIVDAESVDTTRDIAASAGAQVFILPWKGYGYAKNYGNSKCKASWVLSIDADEIISTEMAEEIRNLELEDDRIYSFKLIDHIGQRAVQHSELRPKYKKRLFNRHVLQWNNNAVHELLEPLEKVESVKCNGYIYHHSYNTFEEFSDKLIHYGKLGAQRLKDEGKTPGFLKKKLNPYWRFFRSYVIYLGFLEGRLGWDISIALKNMLHTKYRSLEKMRYGLQKKSKTDG